MAKKSKRFNIYGAYSSAADAKRKAKKVHGFCRKVTIRGDRRTVVLKEKGT